MKPKHAPKPPEDIWKQVKDLLITCERMPAQRSTRRELQRALCRVLQRFFPPRLDDVEASLDECYRMLALSAGDAVCGHGGEVNLSGHSDRTAKAALKLASINIQFESILAEFKPKVAPPCSRCNSTGLLPGSRGQMNFCRCPHGRRMKVEFQQYLARRNEEG